MSNQAMRPAPTSGGGIAAPAREVARQSPGSRSWSRLGVASGFPHSHRRSTRSAPLSSGVETPRHRAQYARTRVGERSIALLRSDRVSVLVIASEFTAGTASVGTRCGKLRPMSGCDDRRTFLKRAALAAWIGDLALGSRVTDAQGGVANSTGTEPPRFEAPADACDSHIHIYDPARFPMVPSQRVPPTEAAVPHYRLLQRRIGTTGSWWSRRGTTRRRMR